MILIIMDYCFSLSSLIGIVDENYVEFGSDFSQLDFCYGTSESISFTSYLDFKKYYISLLVGNLSLEVDAITDNIIGLSGFVHVSSEDINFSFGSINLPDFFDGIVHVDCPLKKKKGLNFVYNFESSIVFDNEKNMVLIGENVSGDEVIRVCQNLYLILCSDKIVGIILKI